jgi:ligand-binding SRPBCC domain-containing protein
MKTYRLQTKIWLPQDRTEIFAFFADARNLERLTPLWLRFVIVTPDPIEMKKGTRLDYRLKMRGIPVRWQSEIASWDPPTRFVDRQTRGPYTLWVHEHLFTDHQGGTVVADNVTYASPGGPIVQKFLVAPDLRRIFRYRYQILQDIFNLGKQMPKTVSHV